MVLLDQMMPEMNGEMTLKEMVKQDILNKTPVIALTADAIVGAKESYMAMGFDDYLSKPVKYDLLEQMLKDHIPQEKQQAVQRKPEAMPVILIWGDDPEKIKDEKERLEGTYKCVCVTGKSAMEKYLEKHEPYGILHV